MIFTNMLVYFSKQKLLDLMLTPLIEKLQNSLRKLSHKRRNLDSDANKDKAACQSSKIFDIVSKLLAKRKYGQKYSKESSPPSS